jgi:hypothetical protein
MPSFGCDETEETEKSACAARPALGSTPRLTAKPTPHGQVIDLNRVKGSEYGTFDPVRVMLRAAV